MDVQKALMPKFIGFIADYRDKQGRYHHKPIQALDFGAGDVEASITYIQKRLEDQGMEVCVITHIHGKHTPISSFLNHRATYRHIRTFSPGTGDDSAKRQSVDNKKTACVSGLN